MPARFWEISAGSILFINSKRNKNLLQNFDKIPSLLIIALIVFTFKLSINNLVISTIIIVFLTAILINCLKEGDLAHKLLTLKVLKFIGKTSYSFYLWHWGVLTISKWTIGIFWWSVPFQIALMFQA